MQFLTRVMIVLGVLGALGYGSYAFGKYVLSARLFGPQGGSKTPITAAAGGTLQTSPQVDVEVLPAPTSTDDAPAVSANPTNTPPPRSETSPAFNGDGGSDNSGISSGANSGTRASQDPTPRPRRRRRPRRTPRPQSNDTPRAQTPPARAENADTPTRSTDNSDNTGAANNDTPRPAPRAETPDPAPRVAPRDNNDTPAAPRRRREPRTDVAPRINPAPRIEPAPRPRREESPVPVPEGARGGGDSPVPVPG